MSNDASDAKLRQIPPDLISRNKENPRIIFRPAEFEALLESIRLHGIQQPISVFKKDDRFVLIDGERRWRCSLKLNKATVPALVQPEPSPLDNLLLMFNIHSLREQWDLLTMALKLPRVISLLEEELGYSPNEREVSQKTGLSRSTIRRCKLLMELPKKYRDQILRELHKPKSQQKITEDLFIEMERALKTVERAMPDIIPDKDKIRRVLIAKYKNGTIDNKVHFRQIGKIARAANVGFDVGLAKQELARVFSPNAYSIEEAFLNSVGEAYRERDVSSRIETLLVLLEEVNPADLEPELKEKLAELSMKVNRLLEVRR
jgi:ParB family transcriptional regulator, chromosome partitioning protein